MMTPASLLHPDAFLSPLAIDEAVQRALDEDLGRAGDITSIATIPETTKARAIMIARQAGVIAGLPLAVATFQKLSPRHQHPGACSRRRACCRRRAGADDLGPGARGAFGRAHRAEFRRPAFRHRHADIRLCAPHRRHQIADLLHPQDHARPARAGEIRRALRRRLQPSLRARRCDPDQGQSHRGRGRHHAPVLQRARAHAGHLVKVEIEVDTLAQLREVLDTGLADVVLLDNMDIATLTRGGEAGKRPRGAGGVRRRHAGLDCRNRGDRCRLRLVRRADAFGAEFRRRARYRET